MSKPLSMSKPLVVTIPHRLGKEEAVRRLKSGLARTRTAFGSQLSVLQEAWSGDHLDLRIALLGHATDGAIDVADDHVRIEVQLPWLIGMLAGKAKALIERQGQLMLEKK
jgi:Putative polyhydroxyalkanoic acid system protein (PHA_gran_rgn)